MIIKSNVCRLTFGVRHLEGKSRNLHSDIRVLPHDPSACQMLMRLYGVLISRSERNQQTEGRAGSDFKEQFDVFRKTLIRSRDSGEDQYDVVVCMLNMKPQPAGG